MKSEAQQMADRADVAGRYAALLSITEVGLGSLLHGLKLPFSGHTLSLNQGLILTRATLRSKELAPGKEKLTGATVSNVSALLKSLSPAGKKLTPMLAISGQGLLFSLSTMILGSGLPGILMGMVLLSLWAFIQPILLYYLMYGKTILHIADYFFEKFTKVAEFDPQSLLWVLAGVVSVKVVLAICVGLLGYYGSEKLFERYQKKMTDSAAKRVVKKRNVKTSNKFLLAFHDLVNPLFLISLLITGMFFFFVKNDWSQMIWFLMRPIAVGYLLFLAVRLIDFSRLLEWLSRNPRFQVFSSAADHALGKVTELLKSEKK